MNNAIIYLRRAHRFLASHLFYPVLLSSAVAVGMFAGRAYLSGNYTYVFLVWNLILAWIPFLCSLWAAGLQRRYPGWALPIPGLAWLIFFPNAPYLVTDFLHLQPRWPVPLWYDMIMLTTFAWTGCFLAVVSLNTMQMLVKSYFGRVLSWLFVAVTLGLTGFGIYLGRFLNWNSWDLLLQPRNVLADVIIRLINPLDHLGTFGVTFFFAAFLFVCYLTFISAQNRERV